MNLVPVCSQPTVSIQQSYTQSNPGRIYRSALFSLSSITYFACNSSFTNSYAWSLTSMTSNANIALTTNPTLVSSELVIPANTLMYDLYKFTFIIQISTASNGILSNQVDTFIEIVPTGLAIFGIQNGISNVLIGSQQQFILNPAAYSLDFDAVVAPSSLAYTFYCIPILPSGVTTQITYDLQTYLTNSKLPMTWDTTCFAANSKQKEIIV